jgi:hypothetical protein
MKGRAPNSGKPNLRWWSKAHSYDWYSTVHTVHHRTHCTHCTLQCTPQNALYTTVHTTERTVHHRTHCTHCTSQCTPQNALYTTVYTTVYTTELTVHTVHHSVHHRTHCTHCTPQCTPQNALYTTLYTTERTVHTAHHRTEQNRTEQMKGRAPNSGKTNLRWWSKAHSYDWYSTVLYTTENRANEWTCAKQWQNSPQAL